MRDDALSYAIPGRHWPTILDIFELSPKVLELSDYDFEQWCKARVRSKENIEANGPAFTGFLEVAHLQVIVRESFDSEEHPEIALELAKILEVGLLREIQAAGDWPLSRYRTVLLPRRYTDGSIWIEFAIFVGGVTTPLWLFFKDYEKVKSGISAFTKDMKKVLISLQPRSNRIPLERVEPVLLAISPEEHLAPGEEVVPTVTWQTENGELSSSNPFELSR